MKERIVVIILLIISVSILVTTDFGRGQTVVYDCRDAHWHPDVPIEVKKQCSELMYKQWKEKNERKNDPSIHENRRDLLRT
jgi:hypothetical protein